MDDKLINRAALEIDFHRTRSCASDKPDVMERIFWTPIDPKDRPQSSMVRPIDGVKYNYLKAIFDTENSYYSCSRNDMKQENLTREQAEACILFVKDACDDVKPKLCSFDLTFMESVKNSVSDGDLILDQDISCMDGEEYGIYEKASPTFTKTAIMFDEDVVVVNSESQELSNDMQGDHCTNMITSTCSEWQLTRSEDSQCVDDPNFVLHGNFIQTIEEELETIENFVTGSSNTVKNCAWVAEDLTRCRTLSSDTGLRAFESCRQTCGTCTCSDNEAYRFNGQLDKGCEWIKEDSASRCSLEGASDNCKVACDTKCCQDNPRFRFMSEEHKTCKWASKNKVKRCNKRAVANNCPETCGLCPSS